MSSLPRLALATHELFSTVGKISVDIRAASDAAWQALLARFVDQVADKLITPHWGEVVDLGSDRVMRIAMNCQWLDRGQIDLRRILGSDPRCEQRAQHEDENHYHAHSRERVMTGGAAEGDVGEGRRRIGQVAARLRRAATAIRAGKIEGVPSR